MLCFSYDPPLRCSWFNDGRLTDSRHTTFEQLQAIAGKPCACRSAAMLPFRPEGCEHVVSCDALLLERLCPWRPSLSALWRKGAKFRPHEPVVVSSASKEAVANSLEVTLQALLGRLSDHFHVMSQLLDEWAAAVRQRFTAALAQVAEGSVAGPLDALTY